MDMNQLMQFIDDLKNFNDHQQAEIITEMIQLAKEYPSDSPEVIMDWAIFKILDAQKD
jgi:hypothetical protein